MKTKPTAIVQDWFIYQLPQGPVLCGKVYGHSRIEDDHHVRSSLILAIREEEVETLNTVYKLGSRSEGLDLYWRSQGAVDEQVMPMLDFTPEEGLDGSIRVDLRSQIEILDNLINRKGLSQEFVDSLKEMRAKMLGDSAGDSAGDNKS